ncbi:uncharacterized protein ARMOST_08749 [Armillaria ostoyae]|uniref:Uncharacterized protein n=1 Tax=Armillaria ostoyae TaxID=47428 RepID=A0A284R9L0_ARMOS|nr:uncharacterized protein ARMOST_08749 [Armillaria ostoyae]
MRLLLCSLSLALFSSSALATLVNVTVDDQNGDPTTRDTISYTPADAWVVNSPCNNCSTQVDASKAWNETWHVGKFSNKSTSVLQASYPFSGTAVYVNCILAHTAEHPTGRSDMTFFIDGVQVGIYSSEPDTSSPGYDYNVTVFAHERLSSGRHIIQIQSGHIGGSASLILLDSIIYSHDDDDQSTTSAPVATPSPAPNSSTALENTSPSATRSKIIGGILGSLGGALVIGLACCAYLRWRRKSPHILPITKHEPGSDQPGIARLGHHRRLYSFNPNLLVRKIINKPVNAATMRDTRHRPPPLQAELLNTQDHGSPFPSGISSEDYSRLLSVQQWRRQTYEETASVVSPGLPDMSEELSSYYEDATDSYRTRAPPQPRPARRFTVMNG